MQPFTKLSGVAAPLPMINVDTDMIIPKQFLKTIERTGLGKALFYEDALSSPTAARSPISCSTSRPIARRKSWWRARISAAARSREHAPWALLDFGIRCVIAPSFADIFYNNCFKNGILPIALPQAEVDKLMDDAERGANAVISVDLEKQEIRGPDGGCIKFEIDPFRKQCLLNGWDDIGLTLRHEKEISAFEARANKPALAVSLLPLRESIRGSDHATRDFDDLQASSAAGRRHRSRSDGRDQARARLDGEKPRTLASRSKRACRRRRDRAEGRPSRSHDEARACGRRGAVRRGRRSQMG